MEKAIRDQKQSVSVNHPMKIHLAAWEYAEHANPPFVLVYESLNEP